MSHYRRAIRDTAVAAMAAAPAFQGFTQMSAWAQGLDLRSLPVWGIATPREVKAITGLEDAERAVDLVLVLKRAGGDDLEDLLDEDSHAAEVAIVPGLRAATYDSSFLRSSEIRLDAGGEKRVGTLTMTFQIKVWTEEPLT